MRVVHVYRPKRPDTYSIEMLFRTVGAELRDQVDLVEFVTSSREHVLSDVKALRRLEADVYHITGDVNYLAMLLPRGTVVLTIHDIGHYLIGLTGWRRAVYRWMWMDLPMRASAVVTAVSEKTRDDIATHFPIHGDQVEVVPNCHGASFHYVRRPFNEREPRVLQVGTKPYKNVARVIEALRGSSCTLVVVGALSNDLRTRIADAALRVENVVDISQEELVEAYISSDIVTFASVRGEGFGVPIIEAQAVGRPVVTSNISPLCDVAGAGACLVDPYSVDSIRLGIDRLVHDAEYRDEVVEQGRVNAAGYSPEKIGGLYRALYERVASS